MCSKDLSGLGGIIVNKEEGLAHNFDHFAPSMIEKAMKKGYDQQFYPTTFNSSEGPFEFYIPGSNEHIFFPHTRLYIKAQILKVGEGGNLVRLEDDDAVTVANLLPHSLFKQVDVEIGGVNTSSQDQLYPYKAYLETLLSYANVQSCSDSDRGHLAACSHFIMDDAGEFDAVDGDGNTKRSRIAENSRFFDFCIPLHADIMQSVRALPPNIPVKIMLTRNPDAFSIMNLNDEDYRINLLALKLYIRKIECDPIVYKDYTQRIQKHSAMIPFTRSVMKKYLIAQNSTNLSLSGIFRDHIPRQIVMVLVKQTRVDGRKNENPFYFQPYGVNYINLKVDGQNYPPNPYQPDFENGLISRELRALYDNTGTHNSDGGFNISREMFTDGYTIFAWDLTPDSCNGWHYHNAIGRGIDLDLTFSAPLANTANLLIYASFESSLFINKENIVSGYFPS
jgi:hypothetical protein